MQLARPLFATDPTRFGRRRVRASASPRDTGPSLRADLHLFVATFLAGFVFVSILIS
jgi:hypothetical protein